jgi:hypothetical protein
MGEIYPEASGQLRALVPELEHGDGPPSCVVVTTDRCTSCHGLARQFPAHLVKGSAGVSGWWVRGGTDVSDSVRCRAWGRDRGPGGA